MKYIPHNAQKAPKIDTDKEYSLVNSTIELRLSNTKFRKHVQLHITNTKREKRIDNIKIDISFDSVVEDSRL